MAPSERSRPVSAVSAEASAALPESLAPVAPPPDPEPVRLALRAAAEARTVTARESTQAHARTLLAAARRSATPELARTLLEVLDAHALDAVPELRTQVISTVIASGYPHALELSVEDVDHWSKGRGGRAPGPRRRRVGQLLALGSGVGFASLLMALPALHAQPLRAPLVLLALFNVILLTLGVRRGWPLYLAAFLQLVFAFLHPGAAQLLTALLALGAGLALSPPVLPEDTEKKPE